MADDSHTDLLATDLDGTLIPMDSCPRQIADLHTLSDLLERRRVPVLYVTGRHLASILAAQREQALPRPQWVIADVGTSLYRITGRGVPEPDSRYQAVLAERSGGAFSGGLRKLLRPISGLELQEEAKQGLHKLSYYSPGSAVAEAARKIEDLLEERSLPLSVIASVDPVDGRGLIDVVPRGISKAFALQWWAESNVVRHDQIVFAGDSGNDRAALVAGYRCIVVANAPDSLKGEVQAAHGEQGWEGRLYLASGRATSGVLEGCQHFGVISRSS